MKLTKQNTIPQCFAIGILFQTLLIILTAIGIALLNPNIPSPKWIAIANLGAMTLTAICVFASLRIAKTKTYMLPTRFVILLIIAFALLVTAIGIVWHNHKLDVAMVAITLLLTLIQPLYEGVLYRGAMWHKVKKVFYYKWRTWLIHLAVATVCQTLYTYGIYQFILSCGSELVDPMNIILTLLLYGTISNAILGGIRCMVHNFMVPAIVHSWINFAVLYFVIL